ncbi:MAG: PHP domain-containing protein [bacterium]|nr:PHP domain-containing protein [bacterium]
MMNPIDLQIQSNKSDGKYPPAELVERAKRLGLTTVAITDHDSVAGVREAMKKGEEVGVKVISGIEMSCNFLHHEFHLLGFGMDDADPALLSALALFQEDRVRRAEKMVENLNRDGFVITMKEVRIFAEGSVARPAIAEALLMHPENKSKLGGDAYDISTVIRKFLVEGKSAYVGREHVAMKDAIELLHNAGGVAVWSHPAIHLDRDAKKIEETLEALIGAGLDGVEAFHPDYSEDEVEFLNMFAGKYGILRTAGSDFHRDADTYHAGKNDGASELGGYNTYGFSIDDIVPKLEEAIQKRRSGEVAEPKTDG